MQGCILQAAKVKTTSILSSFKMDFCIGWSRQQHEKDKPPYLFLLGFSSLLHFDFITF